MHSLDVIATEVQCQTTPMCCVFDAPTIPIFCDYSEVSSKFSTPICCVFDAPAYLLYLGHRSPFFVIAVKLAPNSVPLCVVFLMHTLICCI